MSTSLSTGRVFVIGAPAIELDDLVGLLRELPPAFRAPLLVAVHNFREGEDEFAISALSQATSLECAYAEDHEPIRPGRLYLARPDKHMLIEGDTVRVVFGPKENRHRPSLDPLFRTAALSAGRRTVAVVLCGVTGTIDDGLVGLCLVKEYGGTVIIPRQKRADSESAARRDIFRRVFADHEPTRTQLPGLLRALADPGATQIL